MPDRLPDAFLRRRECAPSNTTAACLSSAVFALPNVPPRMDPSAWLAASARRRAARLAVHGQVQVAISGLDLPLELRDLSFCGFGIRAPRQFFKGMTHWFTFSTAAGSSVSLVAKAVHCYTVEGEKTFVSGWEFMAGTSDARRISANCSRPSGWAMRP